MDKIVSMEGISRPVLVMLVALILLLLAFAPHAADQGQARETPPLLLGAAATAEGRPTQPTWVDDLEHRLGTYFKTKYPTYASYHVRSIQIQLLYVEFRQSISW